MAQKFDARQVISRIALGQLLGVNGTELDDLLASINKEFNAPLRLNASSPADSKINFQPSEVEAADLAGKSITPISSQIPTLAASTIDFQTGATTGGTINITFPNSTVGFFRRVGFSLDASGTIQALFSAEAATIGALANAGTVFVKGALPIGWLDLEATAASPGRFKTAGSATNIIEHKVSGSNRVHRIMGGGDTGSGSGSGSGKNYLSAITTSQSSTPNTGNGDFSSGSTTGWSLGTVGTLTNGIPTGTPTFGSGASGNLSISTVSSGQLAGSYSLSYASSAATTQGNMLASDAFYIDNEDQAKVLGFKFYYKAQTNPSNANWSGTSSNSFGVAVYDVTNSAWLANTSNFGMTQNSGIGICSGTFQTASNTTQLRFVVYNANATSGAVTVYFDDFFVGPQIIPQGAVVTDWQSFTPTGSWTTNTTYTGYWRRVGDTLEVSCNLLLGGAPTAAPLTVNLPSGISIDAAKIAGGVNGSVVFPSGGIARDNGSIDYPIRVGFNSATSLAVYVENSSGTYGNNNQVSNTVPVTFGSPDNIWFSATNIPIVGWSSNVQMSNDTDTRVVAASYGIGSGQTLTVAATFKGDTKFVDTHGAYNTSTGLYTVPVSGIYEVGFQLFSVTATTGWSPAVRRNGSIVARIDVFPQYAGGTSIVNNRSVGTLTPYLIYCNAGDTLDVYNVAAIGTGTLYASVTDNYISIKRLTGPSVIAASESVNARYATSAAQSIPNNTITIINYDTKTFDSHSATTTGASWKYTAPVSGIYSVSAMARFTSATWTAGTNNVIFYVYKNGSVYSSINVWIPEANLTAFEQGFQGTDLVKLVAGDYIDIRIKQASGGSLALQNTDQFNYVCVSRIGN